MSSRQPTGSRSGAQRGIDDLKGSPADSAPSPALPAPLAALWWAHRGGWDAAHTLVQDDPGRDAAWVHAYLHRREGDAGNAAYWYRRAGRVAAHGSLETEWEAIAAALLPE